MLNFRVKIFIFLHELISKIDLTSMSIVLGIKIEINYDTEFLYQKQKIKKE